MGLREQLLALLNGPTDPEENPEPVGRGEDPTTEPDAPVTDPAPADPTVDPTPADPAEAAPDGGDGTTGEPAGGNTLPDAPTAISDEDRDNMERIGRENEALREENQQLRDTIARLGGDDTFGIVEEVVEAPADPADEYDPEADVADHEAHLAALRGDDDDDDDDADDN